MGVFRGLALDNKRNRRFRNGGFFYYCFCLWVSVYCIILQIETGVSETEVSIHGASPNWQDFPHS